MAIMNATKMWVGWIGLCLFASCFSGCEVARNRAEAHDYVRHALEELQRGDYEGCVYLSSKALARSPELGEAYLLRAYAEMELKNLSNALLDVETALRIRPESTQLLLARAMVHQKFGNLPKALEDADQAVALEATLDTIAVRLDLRGRSGDAAGVSEDLRQLTELGPEDAGCLNARAWSMMLYVDESLRDPEEILDLAERAVTASQREDPAVLDTLACALADVGQMDEALMTVREALELGLPAPNLAEVERHLLAFEAGEDWRMTQE